MKGISVPEKAKLISSEWKELSADEKKVSRALYIPLNGTNMLTRTTSDLMTWQQQTASDTNARWPLHPRHNCTLSIYPSLLLHDISLVP